MIKGAPIGKRFDSCTFENFEITDDNREAFDACRRVAESGEIGVVIMGKNGLGKTHLLVATMKEYDRRNRFVPPEEGDVADTVEIRSASELIANAASETPEDGSVPRLTDEEVGRDVHIEYWPLLELTRELRSEIARGFQETATSCRKCDLLVLDDFGAERVTDFVLEELERIVDWRYRAMKPTAVATNLSLKEISGKYGQRAMSRWVQSCLLVGVTGDDRRALTGPV